MIKIFEFCEPETSRLYYYAGEEKTDVMSEFESDEAIEEGTMYQFKELTEDEVNSMQFIECDEDCNIHNECPTISFRKRLENIIKQGIKFPTLFAKEL